MSTRTALVTGATGGIGLHIASQFAERGWTVLVSDQQIETLAAGTETLARLITLLQQRPLR